MNLANAQQLVRNWSIKFQQLVNNKPTAEIPLSVAKLRTELNIEECLLEFADALGLSFKLRPDANRERWIKDKSNFQIHKTHEPDVVKIADAIGDSLFVLLGAAIAHGINIEPVFEEICRSNMSKLWTGQELQDCKEDIVLYAFCAYCSKTFNECIHDKQTERCWIVRNKWSDKIIKSPSYTPAAIRLIIEAQLNS